MVNPEPAQTKKSGFFYGYIVVLVSLIVMTLTFGVNYSFGVFFTPLTAEFGWTKAATSAAYSMKTLIAGFLGIFAGRLTDRFSAKVVAISGAIFLGLGCLLMYKVNAIWQFYLIYGLLLSAGVGGCWPSLMATVPKWFVRQRGLMTGIVASGIGLGTITLPPLMAVTIPLYGWRTSYIIMGAIVFVGIIVAAQFMRRDPHQTGQTLYGAEKTGKAAAAPPAQPVSYRKMTQSWLFWVMCILYFLFGYCLHSIMVHIVPHAIELGISPETAAGVLGTIGAMSVVSKLIMGTASDRLGVKPSLAYGFILLIAALVWVQFANNTWMLFAFAVMFGFAYGGIMTMQSLLAAELFGLSSLGQVLGGVSFIYTVGSALGPLASGYIFDLTDSYRFAFAICVIFAIVALIFVLAVFGKKKNQAHMNNPSPQQDRRMYYGYIIVIASAFIMLTGWGTYYGYGIFFEPLINEFGWTRALASGAYSMSTMLSGLIGVFAGGISDRLGPRKVTAFCGVFFGVGLLLMSRITSAWQMYVLFAIPVSIGIGGLWSPMVSTVARWFVRKRGLMTGIVASGIGLGAVIFPPVISVLISAVGWRTTYIITGAIVLVVILIAAQFLKRDPGEGGKPVPWKKGIAASSSPLPKEFSFKEALRTKRFWTIASVYFLFGYIQVTMSVHTVVFASGLGINPITAASVLSLVGAISIIGRILIGIVSDKVQIKPTLIIIVSLMLVSTVWLQFAGSLWGLYLYGIIFGFAWGGLSAMQSLVSAELFGLRALGIVVGSFSFSFCIGGTIGPVVAGHIYDISGSYRLAFLLLAIAAFIALISVLSLSPPRRKR